MSAHDPNLFSRTLDDKDRSRPGASPTFEKPSLRQPSGSSVTSTPTTLPHPSPNPDMSSHTRSRTMSHADIVRQGKRLSLQFPIQPSAGNSSPAVSSPRSRPQSWIAPSPVPSPDATSAETNILAILASQERYVLELKEELTKAEADLKLLKRHFATQEAIKQRNEIRKVTQLQPLNIAAAQASLSPEQDDEDGGSTWMQKEMERRKALLSGTKTSQRKVFSGSRHLRTLSLLSPDKSYSPSFPQPLDIRHDEPSTATNNNNNNKRPPLPPLARHSTSPDIADHIAHTVNGERYDLGGLSNIQRDALLRTGKQMATDFKDGLLTFIEDIRQATVGEEAAENQATGKAPAKGARKPSDSRPTLKRANKPTSKTGGIADDFWKEHGLSEPKTAPENKAHALKNTKTPQKQLPKKADDFEDWDSWDTPNDKYIDAAKKVDGNSSDESDEPSSPVSGHASSRTSTSSAGLPDDAVLRDSKRNSIPWPDLVKLSPTNLKRTASHLMKEWEKNLTPPPESRESSHTSGDYVGRSVSPAGLP